MKDPQRNVAIVSATGIVGTAVAGSVVHDARSAIVRAIVALISLAAIVIATIAALRTFRR